MQRSRIREEAGEEMEEDMEEDDLVPDITPRHFKEAVRNARRSVSDRDLQQYSTFAQTLQQARSTVSVGGGSLSSFSFPNRGGVPNAGGAIVEEEDDLYS